MGLWLHEKNPREGLCDLEVGAFSASSSVTSRGGP